MISNPALLWKTRTAQTTAQTLAAVLKGVIVNPRKCGARKKRADSRWGL
jgi:hypothetical protein